MAYGLGYFAEGLTHESTDDAFLDARIVAVAPRVAGQIRKVFVADNQIVSAGDPLVEIDPRDFQVQLDQRRAAVSAAQATVATLKANLELAQAQVTSAQATAKQTAAEAAASQATAERAAADLKRAQDLITNHTISPQEFDSARANATAAEESGRAAQAKAASDQSKVGEAQAQLSVSARALERSEAQFHQAELDVSAAELSLSYIRVSAPEAGTITKKAVAEGDYVQAGQRLMALVPRHLYVTANFKETQLQKLRTNQPARVIIDSVRHDAFRAHVDSIMAGSGAAFSLLPPENAVGNYVKVVQRVPVKIVFDESIESEHALGPGMSVVPVVEVPGLQLPQAVVVVVAIVLALIIGATWWRVTHKS
jgi:membrane fusion protein (multidrug efflux system)